MKTRQSSCRKPQEAYHPRHNLSKCNLSWGTPVLGVTSVLFWLGLPQSCPDQEVPWDCGTPIWDWGVLQSQVERSTLVRSLVPGRGYLRISQSEARGTPFSGRVVPQSQWRVSHTQVGDAALGTQGLHPSFETQSRHHKKSKTWVSVGPQKRPSVLQKITKKRRRKLTWNRPFDQDRWNGTWTCAIRFDLVPSLYTLGNTCNVSLLPGPPEQTRTGNPGYTHIL